MPQSDENKPSLFDDAPPSLFDEPAPPADAAPASLSSDAPTPVKAATPAKSKASAKRPTPPAAASSEKAPSPAPPPKPEPADLVLASEAPSSPSEPAELVLTVTEEEMATAPPETLELSAPLAEPAPDTSPVLDAPGATDAPPTITEQPVTVFDPQQSALSPQPSSSPARRVALVTGASRGIGRGIAVELARLGFAVVLNYAGNEAAAHECLALVRDAGGDGILCQGDISVEADRERLLAETLVAYGRIDLLVNNAGVAPTVRADILDASPESFDRLININLKGPYFLTQLVARQMIAQTERDGTEAAPPAPNNGGASDGSLLAASVPAGPLAPPLLGAGGAKMPPHIITISSVSAYTASTNRGDYCISKAGLGMMTALWAARLAPHGIGVYEIRPGIIATDMTDGVREKYDRMIADGAWPIKRWGEPSDVGRAVAAIARGDFPFSTGEVFNVDGGFHLRTL